MDQKIKKAVLEAAEEVLGLPIDEMEENMDLDLFENDLIDSIGCASLLALISDLIGKELFFEMVSSEDFTSLNTVIAAVERQVRK